MAEKGVARQHSMAYDARRRRRQATGSLAVRKARLAAGAGITVLAFLFGVPFGRDENKAAGKILDIAAFICFGAHGSASSFVPHGGSDASTTGETGSGHEHASPAGLYMPMFSTPPKGGAVYNGPPLDQC
jgi:hypothetical protein